MATVTTANTELCDDTLKKLRELRQLNVDSAKGFEECAELVSDATAKQAFTKIAHTRREQAQALAAQIECGEGEYEAEEGSYLAGMHRAWLKVREACSSDSMQTVLIEAEKGEDAIKEAYEEALKECQGSPIHAVITDQYHTVKQTHDQVRDLRDAKVNS